MNLSFEYLAYAAFAAVVFSAGYAFGTAMTVAGMRRELRHMINAGYVTAEERTYMVTDVTKPPSLRQTFKIPETAP